MTSQAKRIEERMRQRQRERMEQRERDRNERSKDYQPRHEDDI